MLKYVDRTDLSDKQIHESGELGKKSWKKNKQAIYSHNPGALIGIDFHPESAEKMAAPCVVRLDMDNCKQIRCVTFMFYVTPSYISVDLNPKALTALNAIE